MKPEHFFLSQVSQLDGHYQFEKLPFYMYAAVYSVNGLNHYPNEIEYKDAMYYIYVPKRLSEKEYEK